MPAEDRIALAKAALERGDAFAAYDAASGAGPDDPAELSYLEVLALSRLGDWENALARYAALGLDALGDADMLALEGRLLKDRAFAAPEAARAACFAEAHDAYHRAYARTGSSFAGINAATTAWFAGETGAARTIAAHILDTSGEPADYWAAATAAEALLLLGRDADALWQIAQAVEFPGANVGARASTFRQLSALVEHQGGGDAADAILSFLRPPAVAFFAGHMFRADPEREAALAAEIDARLEAERIGFGYGALACGADILIAERLLARGAELDVVLPFDEEDFLAQSVRPGGAVWEARYQICRRGARRVYPASGMNYVGDPHQFAFGSAVGMGMAKLRADRLGVDAVQLSISNEGPANGVAGTRADAERWTAAGGRTVTIPAGPIDRDLAPAAAPHQDATPRALRVMVFTDFKGFSQLGEPQIPVFWRFVMEAAAVAIRPYGGNIVCRNTWGDALYLVFDDVDAAISCLLDLRDMMRNVDAQAFGAASGSSMRIAAHYGSVYSGPDPVTGVANFYGFEVSRAARVEPVTPPGHVYITEPLAAVASLTRQRDRTITYVGRLSLAKGYGTASLYRLDRPR